MNIPCYQCVDRKLMCHDVCDKYKSYKNFNEDTKKCRRKYMLDSSIIVEHSLRLQAKKG